ncbi:hypothetical protein BGX38DRAFT_1273383 [Terfezia claveryi]|nr:hypothetical protein BGX38DRAFT_1273383 [Terfezia claveryi]
MVLHHKAVASQAGSARQDDQKSDVAVIYTAIEIFLKGMEVEEVQKLIGDNEISLKNIASITQALVSYNPAILTVAISGELSCVRAANQAFRIQMEKVRERGAFDEINFVLLGKEYADGLTFVPGKDQNSWNLQPSLVDESFGLGDGSLAHTIEHVSAELLKKFSYLALSKDHSLKMNFNLGKSIFSKPFTSDITLPEAKLTPGQLTQLLESKEISCHYDLNFDVSTLAKLESALALLGYQKSLDQKTRIYISHREVSDRRAKEVLWVAKPNEASTGGYRGHLEMVDVRVNEVRTCLITTHSVSNVLDCHAEFTIYQKETPSVLLLHSGRLCHNFRYREGVESLISSKEELKDPSARVQYSSAFVRDDVKVTITKICESKSLVETWEVSVKARKLKQTIKSAIFGGSVTIAQLSADLGHFFDAVAQIRASFNGVGILTEVCSDNIPTVKPTLGPSKKLNAKAEPFQPSSQTITPRSSSEDDSRGTIQVTSKAKEALSPETVKAVISLGIPIKSPTAPKKRVEFPALKPYVTARQLPLTVASNALRIQQATLPSTKITLNSQAGENFHRLIGLEGTIMKREGKVPPPNTPVTPSGPGSPTSKPSRSRAGSVALADDDDDLCGITRVCRQLPMYPPQLKKTQPDLLGSIDEFLRDNINEADDDLICMSPPKNALRLMDEDEDLLVI